MYLKASKDLKYTCFKKIVVPTFTNFQDIFPLISLKLHKLFHATPEPFKNVSNSDIKISMCEWVMSL